MTSVDLTGIEGWLLGEVVFMCCSAWGIVVTMVAIMVKVLPRPISSASMPPSMSVGAEFFTPLMTWQYLGHVSSSISSRVWTVCIHTGSWEPRVSSRHRECGRSCIFSADSRPTT